MAFYTTQLRDLVENGYDLGLKDYPIFNEAYREILNKKIIDHYYMREIGAETPALFVFYLNRKMQEIMPYYNKLYESELKEYDPLITNVVITDHIQKNNDKTQDDHTGSHETDNTSDYTRARTEEDIGSRDDTFHEDTSETRAGTVDQTNTKHHEGNTFGENRGVNSQTPQQQVALTGIMYNAVYATDGSTSQNEGAEVYDENGTFHETNHQTTVGQRDNKGHEDTTLNIDENIKDNASANEQHSETAQDKHYGDHFEDFHEEVKGLNTGSQPQLIDDWRNTFLNIDMMIIDNLSPLFMMLFCN